MDAFLAKVIRTRERQMCQARERAAKQDGTERREQEVSVRQETRVMSTHEERGKAIESLKKRGYGWVLDKDWPRR